MEPISNLIGTASLSIKLEENKFNNSLDPHITDIVNKLFTVFYGICRGFEKQYQDRRRLNLEKTQWIKAFMDVGLNTLEKIDLGVRKFRLASPINTPTISQFIAWCTPEPKDIGLPELEQAYEIAIHINRQFSDYKPTCQKTYTVIRHVINQIGSSQFRSMRADSAFKTFERYYPIAYRQFVEGRLKEIPKNLTEEVDVHPENKERSNKARLDAMAAIRNMGIPIKINDAERVMDSPKESSLLFN